MSFERRALTTNASLAALSAADGPDGRSATEMRAEIGALRRRCERGEADVGKAEHELRELQRRWQRVLRLLNLAAI